MRWIKDPEMNDASVIALLAITEWSEAWSDKEKWRRRRERLVMR